NLFFRDPVAEDMRLIGFRIVVEPDVHCTMPLTRSLGEQAHKLRVVPPAVAPAELHGAEHLLATAGLHHGTQQGLMPCPLPPPAFPASAFFSAPGPGVLDDRRGPEEAGDRLLGVDRLAVLDVALVTRPDAEPVAGAVDVHQPLVVDPAPQGVPSGRGQTGRL